MEWTDDDGLFGLIRRELFTAVLGDVLDSLGLRHQFLPAGIQPLDPGMVLVGRALPVLAADLEPAAAETGQRFGRMLEALDDLKPGEVYTATGASLRYALWGELMSTRARALGAAGAVLDGYARDTGGILRLNFPTFSRGRYAQDISPRGQVVDFRVPVEIEGVRLLPGDLLVGDREGVLVVPRAAEAEAVHLALAKVRQENLVRQAIEQGMSAVEAFARFGVL